MNHITSTENVSNVLRVTGPSIKRPSNSNQPNATQHMTKKPEADLLNQLNLVLLGVSLASSAAIVVLIWRVWSRSDLAPNQIATIKEAIGTITSTHSLIVLGIFCVYLVARCFNSRQEG